MPTLLAKLDRRLLLMALAMVVSLGLLSAGLLAIATSLGNGADLPSQGSIQDILGNNSGDGGDLALTATAGPAVPPPPAPVRIAIPRVYVDAPVVAMGLSDDSQPEVPDSAEQVAWYTFSAAPGHSGNAVFSGHVDWITRSGDPIPGAFYRLRELEIGDSINLQLDDGTQLLYRVTGNVAVPYDDPNVLKVMGAAEKDVVTLITCGGTWKKDYRAPFGGNYSHRIIVRAERVFGVAGGGAAGG
ncbi:MAG TPA: class F sortase [Dehalococcoidia bacterium]|nr:class F sortase [Dehalococcoidia bacterium]